MSNNSMRNDFSGSIHNQGLLLAGNQIINSSINIHANNPCLQALRVTDPRADKDRILADKDKLLKEAYDWIFSDDSYLQWHHSITGLLWIKGDPGKGKTMLIFALIEELSRQIQTEHSHLTALSFFICQATDPRINNAISAIRSLIYLLILQYPSLQTHLQQAYDSAGSNLFNGSNSFFELRRIFLEMLADDSISSVYLFVDALDECISGRPELLDLIGTKQAKVKWIVTSRNHLDIEAKLKPQAGTVRLSLEMNQTHISRAVAAYINVKVQELPEWYDYEDELKTKLLETLQEKAEDTFLWVALACKQLRNEVNPWDALSALEKMPSGLEPLYEQMMKQIEEKPSNSDLCKKILVVVILGLRPMHLTEIEFCAGLPGRVSGQWIRYLVNQCGSFLTIRDDIVYLVHQSAKDYFTTGNGIRHIPGSLQENNRALALRLLGKMTTSLKTDMCNLKFPGTMLSEANPDFKPITSTRYACQYWVDHIDESLLDDQGPVHQFLRASLLHWLEALSLMRETYHAVSMLHRVGDMIKSTVGTEIRELAHQAQRLVLNTGYTISRAPLQVYCSALIFSMSKIRDQNARLIPGWIAYLSPVIDLDAIPSLTLEGHQGVVNTVVFSQEGQLASGSSDKTIRLWDVRSLTSVATLNGHTESVRAATFLNEGQLVSVSSDHTVQLWDIKSGSPSAKLQDPTVPVLRSAFSQNGELISASNHTAELLDIRTMTKKASFNLGPQSITTVAISNDGLVAIGLFDGTIQLWDPKSASKIEFIDTEPSTSTAFSPQGQMLASGYTSSKVRIWTIRGLPITQLPYRTHGSVNSLAFSLDGEIVAAGLVGGKVLLWNVNSRLHLAILEGHNGTVTSVSFSPSGFLASGSSDNTIRIWELNQNVLGRISTMSNSPPLAGSKILDLKISPDEQLIACASYCDIRVWDVRSAVSITTLLGHTDLVLKVAFSPDGQKIASASCDTTLRIWDARTGVIVTKLYGYPEEVSVVAYSPDGSILASGSGKGTIRLWNTITSTTIATLKPDQSQVEDMVFSPSGNRLATVSSSATIQLWDTESWVCIATFNMITQLPTFRHSLAFSIDGTQLRVGEDTTLSTLLDVQKLTRLKVMSGLFFQTGATDSASDGGWDIGILRDWLFYNGKRCLWLPETPKVLYIYGNTVAIGTYMGRCFWLHFDASKFPR